MRMRQMRRILGLGSLVAPAALWAGCLSATSSTPPPAPNPEAGAPGEDGSSTISGQVDGAAPTPDAALPDSAQPDVATPAATDLTATPLDFGPADCGSSPASRSVTFHNTGGTALTYSAALTTGTAFAIQGASSGTVAPGEMGTITVAPAAVPGTAIAGTVLADTLTVTTNVPGQSPVPIPVHITPQGGSLQITPAPVDFGQAFLDVAAAPLPVVVKNVGTKSVTVSLASPSDPEYTATWTGAPTAIALAPGDSLTGASIDFLPTSAGTRPATVAVDTQGPLCAPASPIVSLTGVGSTAPIAIAPGSLDFKTTACAATSLLQPTVTLTNASSVAVTYASTLKKAAASPYALVNASGTVPANGKATITVKANKVPAAGVSLVANALDDSLSVTTGAGGGGAAATIGITQAATGAILVVSMPTTDFGQVIANAPGSLPYSVTNSGNVAASVTVGTTGAGFAATNPGGASVPADATAHAGTVTFTTAPPYGGTSGSFTLSSTTPLCQAASPAAIPLTATKAGPVASFSPATLTYLPRCGQPPPATDSITITNNGTIPLALSNVTASSGFTVTSFQTPIDPAKSGMITVQANAPSGESGGQVRKGTVSFTTNEYANPGYTVNLSATIQGANLGFYSDATGKTAITQQTTLCCGSGASACEPWWACSYTGLTYYIFNSGNSAVTLGTAVVSESAYFSTSALLSSTLAPGTSQGAAPYGPDYTSAPVPPACGPTGYTTHPETIQYSVTSGDVCMALPTFTVDALGTVCP